MIFISLIINKFQFLNEIAVMPWQQILYENVSIMNFNYLLWWMYTVMINNIYTGITSEIEWVKTYQSYADTSLTIHPPNIYQFLSKYSVKIQQFIHFSLLDIDYFISRVGDMCCTQSRFKIVSKPEKALIPSCFKWWQILTFINRAHWALSGGLRNLPDDA